jgi:hypothetical protein
MGKLSGQMRRCRGFIFYSFLLRQTKKFATPAVGLPSVIPRGGAVSRNAPLSRLYFFVPFCLGKRKSLPRRQE